MILTTDNIDRLLGKKSIQTENIKGKNASIDNIKCKTVTANSTTSMGITVGDGDGIFFVNGNNISMGYDNGVAQPIDADVDITGTLTYNGERIENLIAHGGQQLVNIDCQTFKRTGASCDLGDVGTVTVVPANGGNRLTLPEYISSEVDGKDSFGEWGKQTTIKGKLTVNEDTTIIGHLNANAGLDTHGQKIICGDLDCEKDGNIATGTVKANRIIGTDRVSSKSFTKDDKDDNATIYLGDCEQIRVYEGEKDQGIYNLKEWTEASAEAVCNYATKISTEADPENGVVQVGGDKVLILALKTKGTSVGLYEESMVLNTNKVYFIGKDHETYYTDVAEDKIYLVTKRAPNDEYYSSLPTLYDVGTGEYAIYDELFAYNGMQIRCHDPKNADEHKQLLEVGWHQCSIYGGQNTYKPTVYTQGVLLIGQSIYLPPFNRIQMYPSDAKGNPTPAPENGKPLPDVKYVPFMVELKKALGIKGLTMTNETDAAEDYDYNTDKVTNEETGEEEQGTRAPSIFTKGGILAVKRIISGKSVTAVDPTDITKHSTLASDHITTDTVKATNLFASEWVTANNATITEGISAQNGTFTNKLETKKLTVDETASINNLDVGDTCSINNLHARETTTDHIMPTEGSSVTIYGDTTVEGGLTVNAIKSKIDDQAVTIQDLSSRVFSAAEITTQNFSTYEITSELDEIPAKKRIRFEDPMQSDVLNRDQASEVIGYKPSLQCDSITMSFGEISFVFHRVTEYLLYVSIINDYTMNFEGDNADKINSESLLCTKITLETTHPFKNYPSNTSREQTASVPFIIVTTASDGTVKHYDVKLFFDGTGLEIKFTGDIFELGKGETKLKTLTFKNLAGFALLPSNNTQENFNALYSN